MGIVEFFKSIPLWVYILVIGTVVIYVWYKLPYMLKLQVKKIFSSKIFIPIIFAFAWWYWYSRENIISMNQSNWWMPVIALGILVIINAMGNLRYHSKQIVTPNFHGSFTKVLWVNGFVILNIGGFDAFGVSIPMAQEILVVREETFEQMENGALSVARVSPVEVQELDFEVQKVINRHIFLRNKKNNVWYGWYDDINRVDFEDYQLERYEQLKNGKELYDMLKQEYSLRLPSPLEIWRMLRDLRKSYSVSQEEMMNIIKTRDDGAEYYKRQKDIYKEKPEPRERMEGGYEEY
jgi:hypothetical protein